MAKLAIILDQNMQKKQTQEKMAKNATKYTTKYATKSCFNGIFEQFMYVK